ncbi:MAG: T9SS type A sorting domain-containing protein [Rhodothermales bacterium]|nr:T9SS type A sorting domain-containing protein [Rhodothermales bacterium]
MHSQVRILTTFRISLVLIAGSLLAFQANGQSIFEVVTTSDSGTGSLREAINSANNLIGADTIRFNISGDGPHIITPSGPLPQITDAVAIDGYSQPGSSPNTNSIADASNAVIKIGLDGVNAGVQNGFEISAGGTTVSGLAIYNFELGGIYMNTTGGNHISGCYVGTDVTGTIARPNANHGIAIVNGVDDVIGGTLPENRNVISGNTWVGLAIINSGTVGTTVQGNFIGLDATGLQPLGNGQHGINAGMAATGTVASAFIIGGSDVEARNVIGSNGWSGILVLGAGADNFQIFGNYVGTDRTGTAARGNGINGIEMASGPSDGIVGGPGANEGNLVAASTQNGIVCQQSCDNVTISGNIVGTDINQTANFGNTVDGIVVVNSDNVTIGGVTRAHANVVGNSGRIGIYAFGSESGTHLISNNYVGTNATQSAALRNSLSGIRVEWVGHTVSQNVVANNTEGIVVFGSGHRLSENSVYANDGIGIDIGGDGRSFNDAGDGDAGNNNGQNYPEIASVAYNAGSNEVTVTYQVPTLPANAFYPLTIEFFVALNGQGITYIGSDTYTSSHYSNGPNRTVTFTPVSGVVSSNVLVATATDSGGQSSEYSENTTPLPVESVPQTNTSLQIVDLYPNPMTSGGTARVMTPGPGQTKFEIFDILGRKVWSTTGIQLPPGTSEISLDAIDLSNGLFILRVTHDSSTTSRKFVVAN